MKPTILTILTLSVLTLATQAKAYNGGDPERPKYCRETIAEGSPIYQDTEVDRQHNSQCGDNSTQHQSAWEGALATWCKFMREKAKDSSLQCKVSGVNTYDRILSSDSNSTCETGYIVAFRRKQVGTRPFSLAEITKKSCESLSRCLAQAMNKGDGKGLAYVNWMSSQLGCI